MTAMRFGSMRGSADNASTAIDIVDHGQKTKLRLIVGGSLESTAVETVQGQGCNPERLKGIHPAVDGPAAVASRAVEQHHRRQRPRDSPR